MANQRGYFKAGLFAAAVLPITLLVGCGGVGRNEMLERAKLRSSINQAQAQADEAAESEKSPVPQAGQKEAPVVVENDASPPSTPAAQQPTAVPTAESVSTREETQSAPAARVVRLDPAEEVIQSAAKLEKIAGAVLDYVKVNKRFPPSGLNGLSWRVYILPQLGYDQLFQQFNLKQAWDSPHNRELISQMPDVFRMPGHGGTKSPYFMIAGPATLYPNPARQYSPRILGDNASSTLLLLEVPQESSAATWTEAVDYAYDRDRPVQALGNARGGYALAAFADGKVARLNLSASKNKLSLAFRLVEEDETKRLSLTSITSPLDEPGASSARNGQNGSFSSSGPSDADASTESWARRAPSPANELATKYLAAAQAAYAQGDRIDAWKWLAGSILAELPTAEWQSDYRWTPALRRPTLGLHVGVAALIDIRGQGDSDTGRRGVRTQEDIHDDLLLSTAPLGAPLLELLEGHANQFKPQAFEPMETNSRKRRTDPLALSYLMVSTSAAELRREAEKAGCDVLAVFQVDHSGSGRSRSVEILLYDLRRGRGEVLLEGRKVTVTAQINGGILDDETSERLQEAKWRLKDYLEDALTPGDWPIKLTKEIAAKRVASLAASSHDQPLPILVEMQNYRKLGLVDDVQMLQAVNELVGGDQGPQLLLGSELKKRRVLRHWLPSDDPAAVVALAERRSRAQDEEDD